MAMIRSTAATTACWTSSGNGASANIGSTACQAAAKSPAATALQTVFPARPFFVGGWLGEARTRQDVN